jgi:transposase
VSKNFRTCDLDQPFLLPPSLQDWLPENHLARFIAELMPGLELSKIYGYYGRRDGRGRAAYHPVMMVRVLLYGYCVGVMSSRRIERASYDDIAFRYLCADQHPDHDTISEFRRQHLLVLAQLFTQVLQLCDKAGLVKLGHVAIDGTKLQANASKHKAMSYNRMEEKEKQLRAEVEKLLAHAEETDAAEDALYGKGNRGDDLTGEMARRESRLKKIAETGRSAEERAGTRQEIRRTSAPGAGPGTGPPGADGATQFHRSGKPDHAGWRAQRELRAGIQCADRSGQRGANNRGRRDHSGEQRQTATGADAGAGGTEYGSQTEGRHRRRGILQRGPGNR